MYRKPGHLKKMFCFINSIIILVNKNNNENEIRMIDEDDILMISDDEPADNRKQAGYVNMGGAQQMTKLPGND